MYCYLLRLNMKYPVVMFQITKASVLHANFFYIMSLPGNVDSRVYVACVYLNMKIERKLVLRFGVTDL
jgi:hypothetical protein